MPSHSGQRQLVKNQMLCTISVDNISWGRLRKRNLKYASVRRGWHPAVQRRNGHAEVLCHVLGGHAAGQHLEGRPGFMKFTEKDI